MNELWAYGEVGNVVVVHNVEVDGISAGSQNVVDLWKSNIFA
jgi:hypothetical protein